MNTIGLRFFFFLFLDESQTISMVPEPIKKKSTFLNLHDTSRFEREYVKPIKSIIESLHTHDILYGGDQNKRKFLI